MILSTGNVVLNKQLNSPSALIQISQFLSLRSRNSGLKIKKPVPGICYLDSVRWYLRKKLQYFRVICQCIRVFTLI
jgi:hypothetical protein